MKTLPGLEWDGELTKEHFKIFCNREHTMNSKVIISERTIQQLIGSYQLLEYKIGDKEPFKKLFGNKTIDKIPEKLWKKFKFTNEKHKFGLKLMVSGETLNNTIEEYLNTEKGIEDMGELFEGYRLRRMFEKEKMEEEAFYFLKRLIIELKDDVEETSAKEKIGDTLIDMAVDGFYKELNGI